MRYALVLRDGPNAGLFVAPHEIENGDPDWQPPPGFASEPLVAIVDPPAYVDEGWFYRDTWQPAIASPPPAGYGGWRVPTDAEVLERAILARIDTIRAETEATIAATIAPATLALYYARQIGDGSLAERIGGYIGDMYREANRVTILLASVTAVEDIDNILPVWPEYEDA